MVGGNGEGAKERLTRDRICEVALETIDANGLESVSMRTLANALGVKASSLYYHFDSKEELLTGVAEFLYRRLGRPPGAGDWAQRVKGTFVQLMDFIQTHPNAAPLLVHDLAYSPVAKKRANVLLKILSRAGLDTNTSASLISNLVALLVGHTFLDVWLREGPASIQEAEEADDQSGMGSVIDLDGSRPWVYRLFAAGTFSPDDRGEKVLTSTVSGRNRLTELTNDPASERRTDPQAVTYPQWEDRSSSDLAFLAGLDALIRGFTPD